jgi:3-oxoadipate enol-lactonase
MNQRIECYRRNAVCGQYIGPVAGEKIGGAARYAARMASKTINGVELAYDEAGNGQPLLLVHAGVADRRMWDDVWPALTRQFRVVRPDLRGYGDTPLPDGPFVYTADLAALLGELGIERTQVIGVSMGGQIVIDLALSHPELVDRVILVAPGLGGWEFGPEIKAQWEQEAAAFNAGDLDRAAWINVEMWLDGPSRQPADVDPQLRRRVFEMQRRALDYENDAAEGGWLVADRRGRLGEVAAPTLVMVGEYDQPEMMAIGRHIAGAIPGARFQALKSVAHLPPMEAPDEFARLAIDFLTDTGA